MESILKASGPDVKKPPNGVPVSPTFSENGDVFITKDGFTTHDAQSTVSTEDSSYDSTNCVHRLQSATSACFTNHATTIRNLALFAMLVAYLIYFGFAIAYDAKLADSLIVITLIVVFLIFYTLVRDHYGDAIYNNCMKPCWEPIGKRWHVIQWFATLGPVTKIKTFLFYCCYISSSGFSTCCA